MTQASSAGTYELADRTVNRLGYGAMQLAGPGVFGPPKDRKAAVAVLREAVASGVNHIDTSDFYGPHVTKESLRRAPPPLPGGLLDLHKDRGPPRLRPPWKSAFSREDLTQAV